MIQSNHLCFKLLGADYEHVGFDEGDEVKLNEATLVALNTPGHSPDSITILLKDAEGKIMQRSQVIPCSSGMSGVPTFEKRLEISNPSGKISRDRCTTLPATS